jgi:hypothetical protein
VKPAAKKTTAAKRPAAPAAKRTAKPAPGAPKAAAKAAGARKAAPKAAGIRQAAPKAAGTRQAATAASRKAAAKPVAKAPAASKAADTAKKGRGRAAGRPRRGKKSAASAAARDHRERKPGLGFKWACFNCGAKFYDLDKPEPVCPRCQADQREKPREASEPSKGRRPAAAPMSRLLEEEEPAVDYEDEEEASELDIETLDEAPGFAGASEDD